MGAARRILPATAAGAAKAYAVVVVKTEKLRTANAARERSESRCIWLQQNLLRNKDRNVEWIYMMDGDSVGLRR